MRARSRWGIGRRDHQQLRTVFFSLLFCGGHIISSHHELQIKEAERPKDRRIFAGIVIEATTRRRLRER